MARERRFAPDVSASNAAGPRAWLPMVELEALRLGWVGMSAACELPEDFLEDVWVSMDREEELLAVVSGKGVGDGDHLRCLQHRLAQYEPDLLEDMNIVGDGCGVSFDYDGMFAFAPTDDLLVLGTQPAIARARDDWSLNDAHPPTHLMPKRRRGKTYLWAAVDVAGFLSPDELRGALDQSPDELGDLGPLSTIRVVDAEAQLGRRYSLSLGGTFGAEADARSAEAIIDALLESPPPGIPDWGLKLLGELELSRDDARVTLTLPLLRREAHQLGLLPNKTEAEQVPAFPWLPMLVLL